MFQAQVYVIKDKDRFHDKAPGGVIKGTGFLVAVDSQRPGVVADGRDLEEAKERYLSVFSGYCQVYGEREEEKQPSLDEAALKELVNKTIEEKLFKDKEGNDFPELSLSELEKEASEYEVVKLTEAGEVVVSQEEGNHVKYLKEALANLNTDLRVRFYVDVTI